MNIILTESQFNLILESTENIDYFMSQLVKYYPSISKNVEFYESIKDNIEKSGCKHISMGLLESGLAYGMSLHDGVVVDDKAFRFLPLSIGLYVLFHEIAHQYQFKKYGIDLMYKPYRSDRDFEEAINIIREREIVADEYSKRKIREFVNKGFLSSKDLISKIPTYQDLPLETFKKAYKEIFDSVGDSIDNEQIKEKIYNLIIKPKPK